MPGARRDWNHATKSLLFAFLVIALCACGGDDSSPSVTDDILPSHLLVDGDRLLIAETGANRVLAWVDEELDIFADASVGLAQPVGIAALPSGNIFVANHGNGMLVELDAKGAFQRTVHTKLGDNRLLSVAVRSDGSVFIVDDKGGFGSLYRVMLP